ncbi:unnamed protein product [Closterium sp. Yama58-4]|nr:unnamed protein product [Closterium sp. Yama58-4]
MRGIVLQIGVLLVAASVASAWSGGHPASMGHHAAGVGHHHDPNFQPDDPRYNNNHFLFHQSGNQPPPLFDAVAAVAAAWEIPASEAPKVASAEGTATSEGGGAGAGGMATIAAAAGGGATGGNDRPVIIGPVDIESLFLAGAGNAAASAGPAAAKGPPGPCSSLKKVYIINVTKVSHLSTRTMLPPTSTVVLYLKNDLALTKGLLFNAPYSCSILMSEKWPGFTISSTDLANPVIRVWNANNFVSMNVNYKLPVTEGSPECTNVPELGSGETCPAVSVYKSYGVQIGMGTVYGRVDVLRSMVVRIDSLKVTGVPVFSKSPGAIRVAMSGYGPDLLRAGIVISSNEVYGVDTPIVLHRGAVGITVNNNFVHNFIFAGIRCGADVHYSGDCMLTRINWNRVVASGRNTNGDHDAAGIYYCTHWFNPGNRAFCNYVFNGDHCYYLDYCTSGVLVRGGACINTYDGMKVNNGKRNVIKHVAMKGTQGSPGWTTCFTVTLNNCLKDPGSYWEAMRAKYYNTPAINARWPWMQNVCKETSAFNGVLCNPPGEPPASVTGACSGYGTDNLIDLITVNTSGRAPDYKYCEKYPAVPRLNKEHNIPSQGTTPNPWAITQRAWVTIIIITPPARTTTLSPSFPLISSPRYSHRASPGIPAGYQPSKSRPQGACSSLKKVYIINVTSAADFAARASLPPTSTVILYLRNDLTLPKGLFFRRQQSCTILMSSKWPGYTLTGGDPTYPVLRVWNTNNFLSMNVNYYLPVTESSPECTTVPELGKGVTCPTISIHRSYGVQIGKGNIFGRVDVFRSMGVRLDSLTVTGVASFDKSPGVIRVAMCGYGPALLQANIIISNNEVYGVNTPIVLHRGAVGVTVTNNYIHNYIFAGIRCGADVHYSGDCMLTRINSNLVISSGRNLNGDHDSAGIYYCTHWFNPGNSALCNYIFNGDHCYYLDYCTSGVLVRGGACINTYDGMKVNNGKRNIIRHVAMKGTQGSLGWTSCLTVTINNCLKDPGSYWEAMRVKYYNSDRINRLWPWMQDVCKETSANGGVPCNPPGQPGADVTGACSGLGTDNLIDVVAVNTTDYGLDWKFCDNYTITEQLNTQINITLDHPYAAGFRNYRRNDLGLKKSSVILKYRPNYLSCQLGLTGPRKFSEKSFYRGFNIPMPWGFRKVVRMDTKHIIDQDLITSAVRAQMKAAGDDGEYSWLGKPFLVGS